MPTYSAVAIILREQNQEILLHKREDFRVWTLPGGRIEPGETWETAARREVYEETGYEIAIDGLSGEYWRPHLPHGGDLTSVGVGHVVGGAPITRGPETLEVRWFPCTALPASLDRFARIRFMRLYIHDALSDMPKPIKRTLPVSVSQVWVLRFFFGLRDLRNRVMRRP